MHSIRRETSHCVIIPSYNSGPLLIETVASVLRVWRPLIVVIDGSTDGSESPVDALSQQEPELHLLRLKENQGKGAAVLHALDFAHQNGWGYAVVFDSDGQHEVADIPKFIAASRLYPNAMVLGVPIFGPDAPAIRVAGHLIGNWWTNLETLWGGIQDSLFGFRVYPVAMSLKILHAIKMGRRFDFDTQLVVRLYWAGFRPLNIRTRVRYWAKGAGGVSHFRYVRDNILLIFAHALLLGIALTKIPKLLRLHKQTPLQFPD
ncbi:MAG: glycosyltransferase family 2 protein [Verrucomicrobiota bacterium]